MDRFSLIIENSYSVEGLLLIFVSFLLFVEALYRSKKKEKKRCSLILDSAVIYYYDCYFNFLFLYVITSSST